MSERPFNFVEFVTVKRELSPLKRLVEVADTARDVFSVGTAVVDGAVLYHYATSAKSLVGVP